MIAEDAVPTPGELLTGSTILESYRARDSRDLIKLIKLVFMSRANFGSLGVMPTDPPINEPET